jgi:hypothetical protein
VRRVLPKLPKIPINLLGRSAFLADQPKKFGILSKNKIKGFPILKLAMVKRFKVKKFVIQFFKKNCQKFRQKIHQKIRQKFAKKIHQKFRQKNSSKKIQQKLRHNNS